MANKKKAKAAAADSSLDKVTDYRFPEETFRLTLGPRRTGKVRRELVRHFRRPDIVDVVRRREPRERRRDIHSIAGPAATGLKSRQKSAED